MNSMDRVNEKINLQDIKEFENRCGIKLPSEYIDFLLKYNGGYPKASTFKISEEQGETVVNKFYGIGKMCIRDRCYFIFINIWICNIYLFNKLPYIHIVVSFKNKSLNMLE